MANDGFRMRGRDRVVGAIVFCVAVAWTFLIHGALPYVTVPTMGQAASMLGYAQDFSHMHWYTLHGYSFGYPAPVPLATGLPLAVVTGWFLRLGMSAADGYTAAVACGLLLGFVGAFRLAARLGASFYLSVLAAVAWITMPMTWAHEAYSSLALGMAMLPLYVSSAQACLERAPGMFRAVYGATEFVVLCTVALFMDGYTFMMFATVAWLSLGVTAIGLADGRWRLLARVVPLYALGFLCAWLLYTGYMGRSAFDVAPMGFFRGWAVDLSFIVWPSHGQLWAWDMLGLGQVRTEKNFFGDPSVWCTTFALPLILAGMLALWSLGRPTVRSGLWMAVAVLGLYLALGPTLKVDATKATVTTDQLMPASAGVISTGTEWLYLHVPGFRSMRAVYRWEAVFLLGLWGLVALAASRAKGRSVWAWAVVYSGIIFFCMPHLGASWLDGRAYRRGFASIDRELAAPLSSALRPGERVFFLPLNNDVIATYLSPRLGIRSYSVAGDKQLEIVQPTWSSRLRRFEMYHFDQSDLAVMRRALVEGDVDAMVVTYYNSLWSAHLWPCAGEAKGYSQETLSLYGSRPGFACPASTKRDDAPLIEAMRHDPLLAVHDDVLFAVVRLKPEYAGDEGRRMAKARLFDGLAFPADVAKDEKVDLALDEGWYAREPVNRWSGAAAAMTLPLPASCHSGDCRIELDLSAFAASPGRPVEVIVTPEHATPEHVVFRDESTRTVSIRVPWYRPVVSLAIDVPSAASPASLGISADTRVLGVSLSRIDVRPGPAPASQK